VVVGVVIAASAFVLGGITGATATSSRTTVTMSSVTPAKSITAATSVAAGKAYSFVASGGTTTVPSNATVVQLSVTVKGTKAGMLTFAPTGDPSNASPTTLSWTAGGTNAGLVNVTVGLSNKVDVLNTSTAAATVGVKIVGYSTQITAGSINGSGGSAGQVLTNNGDGTTRWATSAGSDGAPLEVHSWDVTFTRNPNAPTNHFSILSSSTVPPHSTVQVLSISYTGFDLSQGSNCNDAGDVYLDLANGDGYPGTGSAFPSRVVANGFCSSIDTGPVDLPTFTAHLTFVVKPLPVFGAATSFS